MNAHLTKAEYDALPLRQDITTMPLPTTYYRDKERAGTVFRAVGLEDTSYNKSQPERAMNWNGFHWDAFGVTMLVETALPINGPCILGLADNG